MNRMKSFLLFSSLIVVMFSPLFLLHLFDSGWWMVFCYVIFFVLGGLYILSIGVVLEDVEHGENEDLTPDVSSSFSLSFAFVSSICLLPIVAFPFLSTMEDFLCKINYVFGMGISTSYEGGIFIMLMFWCALYGLYGIGGITFPTLKKIWKTDYKKYCVFGIFAAIVFFAVFYGTFLYASKDISYQYDHSFKTQMEKDEEDIDRQIESDKNRLIQKTVNDYKRNWR